MLQADGVFYTAADLATVNACSWNACVSTGGNIVDAPNFVDEDGSDYHLQSPSPAIDTAASTDGWLLDARHDDTDFDGLPWPIGAAPNIGAFEYDPP